VPAGLVLAEVEEELMELTGRQLEQVVLLLEAAGLG